MEMIKDLEKHITFNKPDIYWRFEDNQRVLEKIKVLDKEADSLIWNKLKGDSFLPGYSLNENKFETFESIEFSDNYDLVTDKLKELLKTSSTNVKVILTWFSDGRSYLTDLKTFIDNWDDFFYPSSDDLVVINENWDWIIYLAHFESFQFGEKIKPL
jgi:hypothetical protein